MASHESQPRRQNSHAARVKERESHVRRPRKKSKAPLIVGLILAIFVLAAVIALLWIESNCVLVGGKLYRQGDTIDLRGGEVSIAEYDELRARFPDSVILWNVPIGSRSFDSSSTSVSVDNYSEAEIDSFRYLPQLKTIDASDADCYDVIMKTIDAYPNCTVKYQVKLGGSAYAGDTAQLVLDSPAALSELEARLQYFPQLESVDLRAAGLGDDEEDALIDAFPDISFLREVELAGKSFDTSAAELEYLPVFRCQRRKAAANRVPRHGALKYPLRRLALVRDVKLRVLAVIIGHAERHRLPALLRAQEIQTDV